MKYTDISLKHDPMIKNSSDLLEAIRKIATHRETVQIDIQQLGEELDISFPKLVSILTELEQRDKIILEVKTSIHPQSKEVLYEGGLRLMESPLDEEINTTE